jgi:flagellar biosynthetic protein FlhB
MADEPDQSEKTEEPSFKKLQDALEKGDVAKSQELSSFFVLMGATLMILVFATPGAYRLTNTLQGLVEHSGTLEMDGGRLIRLTYDLGVDIALALGLPLMTLVVMAVAGNLVQHRLVWSIEPLKPKTSKISPIAGFKRLFSQESLLNFAKGLFKVSLVGVIIALVLWPYLDSLEAVIHMTPLSVMNLSYDLSLLLMGGSVAVMLVLGLADYAWQRHRWYEKQKMTVKEVKDEYKQQEGDPHVKARLRQIRQERSRKRMMSSVPEATVVVTNPTHYAVALKYEKGMDVPVCVAKGVEAIALKIRQVARENDVPIVENPPLARALHATVDLDDAIPEEHYKAVAEVIGYVMRLREKARRWR